MKFAILFGLLLAAPSAFAGKPGLRDAIGKDLDPLKVRGIYRYECDRHFFEGEGLSEDRMSVACVANQRIGRITAPYHFYLYDGRTATNGQPASILGEKFHRSEGGQICLKEWVRTRCGKAPALRYGLYGERAGIFQVGVSLTTKPEATAEGDPTSAIVGFAAMPNELGFCPAGLLPARVWLAQPPAIPAGAIGNNPPNNFVNANNVFDEKVLEIAPELPMLISREANRVRCNGTSTDPNAPTGSCEKAAFERPVAVRAAFYTPIQPVVCVIPNWLLDGAIPERR